MKTNYIHKIIICSFLVVLNGLSGFAQSENTTTNEKRFYSFEKLTWLNPWLSHESAAGLGIANGLPADYLNYSILNANYSIENGDFQSPYDAQQSNIFNLSTKSIQRFNKTTVMGYFKYIYGTDKEARWNTLFVPNSTPFWYGDSILGDASVETFMTGLKASQLLNDNLIVGLSVDYLSSNKAKKRDLRNLIQYTSFQIVPSVVLQYQNFNIGLDAGYRRIYDYTQIFQIGAGNNRPAFIMNGLWFGTSTIFSSTHSRRTEDNAVLANIYLDLNINDFRFYNRMGIDYNSNYQYDKFEKFGEYESLSYMFDILWQYKDNIVLDGHYKTSQGIGTKVIQRTEYDSASGTNHYFTKDKVPSYYEESSYFDINLSYRKLRNGSNFNESWRAGLGLSTSQIKRRNVSFPNEFSQKVHTQTFSLFFSKNFSFGKNSIDIEPVISYRTGGGTMLKGIDLRNSNEIVVDESWYLKNQLEQEYYHNTANILKAQLGINYSYLINANAGIRANIGVYYQYIQALDTPFKNLNRNLININLGISF